MTTLNKTALYYVTVGALGSNDFIIRYAKTSDIKKRLDNNEILVQLGHQIKIEQVLELRNTLRDVFGMTVYESFGIDDTIRLEF